MLPGSETYDHVVSGTQVNLTRLQSFVVVADSGTIRQAATKLHLTPQAVGAHIEKLEHELGVTLLERTASGSRPTSAGREILNYARRILGSSSRLVEFASGVSVGRAGTISIACYPVHVERMLADILGRFRQRFADVRVDLSQVRDDRRRGWGKSLFDELREGDVDFAIGPKQSATDESIDGCHLYTARIVALVPDDHAHRRESIIPITALENDPVLIAPDGFFSRERVVGAARAAGFELSVAFQSSNPPALLALGSHGFGVPIVADDYPLVGQQRFPYPAIAGADNEPIQTEVWMHWRRGVATAPAFSAFIEITQQIADEERQFGRKYETYYRAEFGDIRARRDESLDRAILEEIEA